MEAILERRSIRQYTNEPVSDEAVVHILRAAMSAPSARNARPWEFIVVRDRATLEGITKVHPYSQMLRHAALAICVCGNLDRELSKGYWVQDCAAATENMLVAIQHLGLGGVWLGVYPRDDRVRGLKRLLELPDNVVPLSLVSIGHPAEKFEYVDRYDPSRIHKEKW